MEARYDDISQWYAEFTRAWEPVCLPYLPASLVGQRLLDLACGQGAVSRVLVDRGALVTAVDSSTGMLDHAEAAPGLRYLQGDATSTQWWSGDPFDGV